MKSTYDHNEIFDFNQKSSTQLFTASNDSSSREICLQSNRCKEGSSCIMDADKTENTCSGTEFGQHLSPSLPETKHSIVPVT